MSVVLHLYVCPFVSERERENGTFVKLQHILVFLNILYILCIIMLFGDILHMSFDFGNHILITYQNSPKSVFYLFL